MHKFEESDLPILKAYNAHVKAAKDMRRKGKIERKRKKEKKEIKEKKKEKNQSEMKDESKGQRRNQIQGKKN